MKRITFTVFSDLHYLPGVFYTEAENRLEKIKERAVKSGSDFVIHLGDLNHEPDKVPELIRQYESIPLPTYHCIGNHECQGNGFEQVLRAYKLEKGYYFFDRGGFRFVVLDLNYMRINGEAVHYDMGNYFRRPAGAQLVTLEETQRAWLKETVISSPYPCVLMSHHSLERANNGMTQEERDSIFELLDELNRDRQRVVMAINGHYHMNHLSVVNNMAFLDLNSASYDWLDNGHSDKYPAEMYEKYKLIGNTLVYENPLSAVITLREDGYIKIEGIKSRFMYGIDRKKAGVPVSDAVGRVSTAEILTAELKLDIER